MMERHTTVRPPSVAGLFYPGDPRRLKDDVEDLLRRAPRTARGQVRALIVPHAGYPYSGYTAACAFVLLKGVVVDTVVIVSPSHREYFDGVSAYPGEAYETPLGRVPVDAVLAARLLEETDLVRAIPAGHREEHAIEVQLPFLQVTLPELSVLPLVMGDQRADYCRELGRALAAVLHGRNALMVASTDLSHYHPSSTARKLDAVMIGDVRRCDAPALLEHLEAGATEACGGGPAAAVMTALRSEGCREMTVLHHCNSGDTTGDHASVVGYLSAAAFSPRPAHA